jgi:hypothetical protein
LESGQVLQAPIYALAVQRLYHLRALGVEFMGLKQGASRGIYREGIHELYGVTHGISALADEDWQAFLQSNEARLCDAVARLRQGIINLDPKTKRCPASCAYFALCRGDRFALLRKQRMGGGEETRREGIIADT